MVKDWSIFCTLSYIYLQINNNKSKHVKEINWSQFWMLLKQICILMREALNITRDKKRDYNWQFCTVPAAETMTLILCFHAVFIYSLFEKVSRLALMRLTTFLKTKYQKNNTPMYVRTSLWSIDHLLPLLNSRVIFFRVVKPLLSID